MCTYTKTQTYVHIIQKEKKLIEDAPLGIGILYSLLSYFIHLFNWMSQTLKFQIGSSLCMGYYLLMLSELNKTQGPFKFLLSLVSCVFFIFSDTSSHNWGGKDFIS